ncbi:MAG: glycosyl hydrolase family 88, partial [Oscillospiraceae bacterium]|nr:glycosyl hydrolase family 88 [Oscillospiraceae bacterium]MDD4368165.1 glycosyl hydrolase family 88 [Oscillospiraceae bacterium]
RQPPEPAWEDSTAAAIAACGLLELAKRVNAGERQLYLNGALRLLQALSEKRCVFDLSNEAIVQRCSARYHEETHEYNIIYGDSYFAEAIFKLNGNDFLIW